jgi:hypothetical protein
MSTLRKLPRKYAYSVWLWILVAVCAYFGYSLYFAVYGLRFGIELTHDSYVYGLISEGPWWWAILYYGSEGLFDSIAGILRVLAGAFAVYAVFSYWKKGDSALPQIRPKVRTALLLEAAYYLSLIPSVIAAFVYYSSREYLYYFDHTPGTILLYVTAIPCLAMVTVIPPLLLMLRSKITQSSPSPEIIKWSCLTGVGYLYVAFWFNYSMSWLGTMVPYTPLQHGSAFLLEPANFASFVLTVFGLLTITTTGLIYTLPVIRKKVTKPNLQRIGAVAAAFGGYFVFNILYYYLTGGYKAHPSVWYEMIGPLHNPDLWCVAFIFIGLSLLFYNNLQPNSSSKENHIE